MQYGPATWCVKSRTRTGPTSWAEADARLEALALAEPLSREPELIRYLHRRTLREESLLSPAMRELKDARFQKIRIAP